MEHAAADLRRPKAWVINEALAAYFERENQDQRMYHETLEGLADVAAGGVIDGDWVMTWIESWGSDNERQPRNEPQRPQKKVCVSIWLTESDREGIRVRTRLSGATRAGWIIQAVRSALTKEPGLSDVEIDALKESNYQLSSMGRNLNQITRRFNAVPASQKPPSFNGVEKLVSDIDAHTEKVWRLIRSSTERWVIE